MLAFCPLPFAFAAANVEASEIVMLGGCRNVTDGVGAYIRDSVRKRLNARGLKSMVIHNVAVPGSTADQWLKGHHGTLRKLFAAEISGSPTTR